MENLKKKITNLKICFVTSKSNYFGNGNFFLFSLRKHFDISILIWFWFWFCFWAVQSFYCQFVTSTLLFRILKSSKKKIWQNLFPTFSNVFVLYAQYDKSQQNFFFYFLVKKYFKTFFCHFCLPHPKQVFLSFLSLDVMGCTFTIQVATHDDFCLEKVSEKANTGSTNLLWNDLD